MFVIAAFCSQNIFAQDKSAGDEVFMIVEEMPEFPGGEEVLRKFIANNVKYSEIAKENGIKGKVYVSFTVSDEGKVIDAKVVRGADPSLDSEALRVINTLPLWKPGKQNGVPVNVRYTVPVNFELNKNEIENN